jgi:RNA polymerase sigma-70 factor (ECF subfamily)
LKKGQEQDLVRRAQEGDSGAFSELVQAHQGFAYHVALRTVTNRQDAEDIVQEAFVRAWRSLAGFRVEARFRTWLYRIVVNLCYSQLPRLRKDVSLLDGPNGRETLVDQTPSSDPELQLEGKQVMEKLQDWIRDLPGQYQIMLLLRHQQGCSYAEIAEIMDLPLGTVKTGIHRARKKLKEAVFLDQEEFVR